MGCEDAPPQGQGPTPPGAGPPPRGRTRVRTLDSSAAPARRRAARPPAACPGIQGWVLVERCLGQVSNSLT